MKELQVTTCFGTALLFACGGCPGSERQIQRDRADIAAPADSLVLTSAGGTEVWFTLTRADVAPNGAPCLERGLEIRRGQQRVKVPLLYTGTPPVLVNDSTMRAVLWTHCQPGEVYLVSLRSGQPVPERRADKS